MAVHLVSPEHYDDQLADKVATIEHAFAPLDIPAIEVFDSPRSHYRLRAEFKIWQQDGQAHYAMYEKGEYKKPYIIDGFPVGAERINQLMPRLLAEINANEMLRKKLFSAEFLTTLSGDALVTLLYHKPLDEQWEQAARDLRTSLGVDLIGRSRKQKITLERDYVNETLNVDGKPFHYKQIEGGFTQPNGAVCEKMLAWAVAASKGCSGDLLELYCGNGNFTLPLAQNFDRVLATEISKTSVEAALHNAELNRIENVAIARMSSEEFTQAMDKVRPFRRLAHIDLDSYNFTTLFVDPPRAGLDPDTLALARRFDRIIYISCNPNTLLDNLQALSNTHQVDRFAVFDQFPYTDHLECGAILSRRD